MSPLPSVPRPAARPSGGRLLLLGRDEARALALAHRLSQGGYTVDWARDDVAMDEALARGAPAAVLAEFDPPGPGDDARLQALLARVPRGTAVIVTGAHDAPRRARLLDRGADDVLRLPVELDELVSRVRAVLRRSQRVRSAAAVLRHGPLELRTDSRQLLWHDQPVTLTSMELRLLETLLRRPQHLHSRAELEAMLYGWDDEASSNTLEVYVHHLRRKLCAQVVRTVRGAGYQLGAATALDGVARRGDIVN